MDDNNKQQEPMQAPQITPPPALQVSQEVAAQSQDTTASAVTPSASEPKKSPNPLVVAGFLGVGLLLSGVFAYVYMGSEFPYKQKSFSKTSTVTPTKVPSPVPTVGGTTDAGLEVQSAAVDAGIDSVNKGLTDVDQGLQDQQGDLSE